MQTFIPGRRQFPRLGGDVQAEIQQTHSQLDQKQVPCRAHAPIETWLTCFKVHAVSSVMYNCCIHESQLTMYQKPTWLLDEGLSMCKHADALLQAEMESAKLDLQKAQAHYQQCCRSASAAKKQKNAASDFKVWLHWL